MTGLERFVEAQRATFDGALAEVRAGAKRSHWMWFILPQLRGLGRSDAATLYGIGSAAEAVAFLDHPILGPRYIAIVEALQALSGSDPAAVFGTVDAMKLRSSLTLFEAVRPMPLLAAALDRWFAGERDRATLELLRS